MPRICFFHGISIYMHYSDHPTPHFHALYAEYEAKLSIRAGEVVEGSLPPAQLRLVRRWARLHTAELMANWEAARSRGRLARIEPLP
ncbi:MAG: DUF4160 domain-containing protein [Actinomycetota bacterium]|nr:DUF4160 domain-containing protein [Actinomycetota bacterium]